MGNGGGGKIFFFFGAEIPTKKRGWREGDGIEKQTSRQFATNVTLPLAGQAVEPLAMPMVTVRPGRCITWEVADPLVSQGVP